MTGSHSKTWLADWLRKNMPTREQMERNRFIRPVAHRVVRAELSRFTTPLLWVVAYWVGGWLLRVDAATVVAPVNTAIEETDLQHFLEWLTHAGIETAFGLVVIAVIAAALSYLLSGVVWRMVVARTWARRARRRHTPLPAE